MYAIIETGGKQHRIAPGDTIRIEKLPVEVGQVIDLDKVLLIAAGDDIKIGAPFLQGAKVVAEVVDQDRAKKIHIIKFKRRKHQMKHQGHRQDYTEILIKEIVNS